MAIQSGLVAIDIDILDHTARRWPLNSPNKHLGRTPLVRIGQAPKQLRIYRQGGGVTSRKLHPVEIFSGSGQCVGYGQHQKTGQPYYWPDASPLELVCDSPDIPKVTRAQLDRFTADLFKVVPRRQQAAHSRQQNGNLTLNERLRLLTIRYCGNWSRAAAQLLSEACEGNRNDTTWAVIASAAGRGVPDGRAGGAFRPALCRLGWRHTRCGRECHRPCLCAEVENGQLPDHLQHPPRLRGPAMFDQPGDVGDRDGGADREGLPDFDAMLAAAVAKLDAHVAAETIPGQNETTTLTVDLLSAGASPTVRDVFATNMVTRFPDDFTRQGLKATWREIAEELKRNAADAARASAQAANVEMTPEERTAERERLWPLVKELAEAPDLLAGRAPLRKSAAWAWWARQHLVQLVFIAGVSWLLDAPINPLVKGASSGGKSFVSQQTLRLFPPSLF